MLQRAVVALVIVAMTACTSMRPIEDFSPDKVQQQVHVGDEVRIVMASGTVYELEVTKVEADSLVGKTDGGKYWRIKYAAIRQIESERVSAAKTGGAIGIGTIVLYAMVVIVVGAMIEGIGEGFGEAFSCIFGCEEEDE